MKILIVMNEYFSKSNGMSISTQRFVEQFKKMGKENEIRILAGSSKGTPDYPLPELIVPIFNSIIKKQGFSFAKVKKDVVYEAVEWADIIHLEDPFYLCSYTARVAKKMNKPCMGTFHLYAENMTYSVGLGWLRPANVLITWAFKHFVYEYCSDIQCPTEAVKERLIRYKYNSNLHVISNGIHKDSIVPRSEKPTQFKDKFVIISVGRYSVEKNQILLFEAIKKSKYADKIQLILAGKGPLENKYRKLSESLPNKAILEFMSQEQLRKTISYSDLYIHCANVEVEGMSCMEAFASGLVPLISNSYLSSTKQYALSENNLFKANDSDSLRDKIDYWIEHPEEKEEFSKKYIEFAKEYDIENSAKKLFEIFENLVNKNN
ncbi:glycosyltransferase [Caviibacter abscessus]|uniref:glycosyltransferase n=1 Tax=Caviibacter abscessus TaxID=1766719 RepID=UPI0008334435|nr:glycosyltransferase [Caviibacter abscessus]